VVQKNTTFPGSIGQMVEPIIPAALKANSAGGLKGDALLEAADRLRNSEPSLIDPLRAGTLKIVGAHYDLDDGKVDFLVE
jgi:carbonic anhydrase